ncbi:MAG: TRAP transporter small permease subunit [Granulosicoccus sp.]|nr:TRAP transporter small permease subunit [Granulosicoccus sp.]
MAEDVDPSKLEIADELIAERRSASPGQLPDDMHPAHKKIIGTIDTMNEWVGKIVCWFVVPLCLAMVYEVVVRKFGTSPVGWWEELVRITTNPDAPSQLQPSPTLWAYDVSRMLYGALFMLGAGYALSKGVHIRADFLYRNWSDRTQGIVDLILYVSLFFVAMGFLFWHGADYAWNAWSRGERAMDTAWMPQLGPVRTAIPLGALFLLLQGVSESLKCWYAATRGRWPV